MKKLLNLLTWSLILVMAFSLVGCSDKEPIPDDGDNGSIIDDNNNDNNNGDAQDSIDPVLAFLRDGDVWGMDTYGEKRQLTKFGDVHHVAWSADEMQVALWRNNKELWIMRDDGTQQELVSGNVALPDRLVNERGLAWSPWGDKIAYGVVGEQTLFIKDLLSDDTLTINIDGELNQGPWWMPGGEMLFSVTHKDGVNRVTLISETGNYIRHLDYLVQPQWTPEGLVLIEYDEASYTGLGITNGLGDNYRQLLKRQLDQASIAVSQSGLHCALATGETLDIIDLSTGKREQVLTQDTIPSESGNPYSFFFAWSGGGEKLAALRTRLTAVGTGEEQAYWDLVIIEPGKYARVIWEKITLPLLVDGMLPLTWSLDNLIYVLQSNSEQSYDVWVIDAEGGEPRLFLENAGLPFIRGAGYYPIIGK